MVSKLGDDEQAETYFQESLALARQIKHHLLIADTLNGWGELHLKKQKFEAASATFQEALVIARIGEMREQVAISLFGLARTSLALSHPDEALRQGQESLAIFEAIGHIGTAEVKQWQATLLSTNNEANTQD